MSAQVARCIDYECDGAGPHTGSETRVYPLGAGGNLIICRSCWERENRYRIERGRETKNPEGWPAVQWATAVPYWRGEP